MPSWSGCATPWQDVYDWKYTYTRDDHSDKMIIYYNKQNWNGLEMAIPVSKVDSNRIDMMLLLIHFKGKYGGPPNP